MASRADSRVLMPPGRLCSDGLKHLVGAVKGPLARSDARYNSSLPTDQSKSSTTEETVPFATAGETAVGELEAKFDKALSDLKQGFDRELIMLRYDLKKEADDRSLKHYIDTVNLKNEVKALEGKIEGRLTAHEMKIELQFSKEETKRLKTYGWMVGAGIAFLSRFSPLLDFIFKKPRGGR